MNVDQENSDDLLFHRDIPLPSFLFCICHGKINSDEETGNFVVEKHLIFVWEYGMSMFIYLALINGEKI